MKELFDAVAEYQYLWMPLVVGMGVGVLMVATGNVVMRRRRRSRRPVGLASSHSTPGGPDYDPFALGSPSDQRKAFRRQGNLVGVWYKLPKDDGSARPGLVLDRSVSGVRLALDEEVAPGVRLLLLPEGASDMTPWTEVEVRTCRAIDDSWEAGCQFVKVPPWSILLMFG